VVYVGIHEDGKFIRSAFPKSKNFNKMMMRDEKLKRVDDGKIPPPG
jgi:hypothetical protein